MLVLQERRPDKTSPTQQEVGFTFLRFVGHPVMDQNTEFLNAWADHLAGEIQEGQDAFVFCHCPDVRLDPWLCKELHQRVNERIAIPPLPWDELKANTSSQPKLL